MRKKCQKKMPESKEEKLIYIIQIEMGTACGKMFRVSVMVCYISIFFFNKSEKKKGWLTLYNLSGYP